MTFPFKVHLTFDKMLNEIHHGMQKRSDEEYYKNLKCLFQGPHQDQDLDNVKNLRALISRKADTQPLEIGTSKSRVLFISSSLHFPDFVIFLFVKIMNLKTDSLHIIVSISTKSSILKS